MAAEIVVGTDECRLALHGEALIARHLSSDCAVVIHHAAAGVGVLARFPSAEDGIRQALSEMHSAASNSSGLIAYLIGRASNKQTARLARQDRLNAARILWQEGILLKGEDWGGDRARSLRFDPLAGRIIVRTEGILLPSQAAAETAALCHLAS